LIVNVRGELGCRPAWRRAEFCRHSRRRAGTGPESHEISPVTAKPTRGGAAQRGIRCARGDVEAGCLDGYF